MADMGTRGYGVRLGWSALALTIMLGMAATTERAIARSAHAPITVDGSAAPDPWKRYGGWNKASWPEFNSLADLGRSPPAPAQGALKQVATPIIGDPIKGRELAFTRARGGGCLSCHVMGVDTPETPGNAGPDLSEIGLSARDDSYLFNHIWDPRVHNPESVMTPWGAHGYYSEDEIRHMVAFLETLKEPKNFTSELDDPLRRPLSVEDRDFTDPFLNPAWDLIDVGKELFAAKSATGRSCALCHGNPERSFKGWAASMPYFDERMGKVIGVAEFVTRHGKATMGGGWLMQSPESTAMTVYLTSLANGQPTAVDLSSAGAKAAAERGAKLFDAKIGQANMSCNDCHVKAANTWIRGQYLGESRNQTPHFPLWRTSRMETWDIRKRLQWCNVQIRPDELPPDAKEHGDLAN